MHGWEYFQNLNMILIKEEFKTEEQAKEALRKFEKLVRVGMDARNKSEETWFLFCPITNDQCRRDCICFKEHMIIPYRPSRDHEMVLKVRDWECRNVQVNGLVYVEKA